MKLLRKLWKDSVISNVIAGGILALISFLWVHYSSSDIQIGWKLLRYGIISLIIFVVFVVLYSILKRKNPNKPKLLLYLSTGGTCRDPMATVITRKIIEENNINLKLDIKGMAVIDTSDLMISYGARYAIENLYGQDLLSQYKCEKITKEIYDKADLILVMSNEVLSQLTKKIPNAKDANKVYLFKEFFGLKGDITNPWPDGKDEETLKRYNDCARELKEILTNNFNHLLEALRI